MIKKLSLEIPKETNTYADALFAVGTASLLKEIYGDTGEPSIKDRGNSFVVEVDCPNGFEQLNEFQRVVYCWISICKTERKRRNAYWYRKSF